MNDGTKKNHYQKKSSEAKLRGEVFTPSWLADILVERCKERLGGIVVDPACGDGAFLMAALRARLKEPGLKERAAEGLYGFDLDPANVLKARENLRQILREAGVEGEVGVEQGNALIPAQLTDGPLLKAFKTKSGVFEKGIDLVIGNPPYVEAKRMSDAEKKQLKSLYPDAGSGPIDLCIYFTQACLSLLKPEGRLAFILPNKVLVARYAEALRRRLVEKALLREVLFLSHLPVFARTAVYPVVLVAGAMEGAVLVHQPESQEAMLKGELGTQKTMASLYQATQTCSIFPLPAKPAEREKLLALCACKEKLSDIVEFRWTISFHAAGLREKYIFDQKPESPFAHRFLGGAAFSGNSEVQRYQLAWQGSWIDYDEARARADNNQLPPLKLFERPKIIICQNALQIRAVLDREGFVLKDTFIAAFPKDTKHPLVQYPEAIVALLNSEIVHFFYSQVFQGGHVGGGYLHFLAPYLEDIPLGSWTDTQAREASRLVELLRTSEGAEFMRLDTQLQQVVAAAFEEQG